MLKLPRSHGSMLKSSGTSSSDYVASTPPDLMSTIGKWFQDAGLRYLCIESVVVAEGSASGVMENRKYKRAVRIHKLVYEALIRLAWKGFIPWLEANHRYTVVTLYRITDLAENLGGICRPTYVQLHAFYITLLQLSKMTVSIFIGFGICV